MNFNYAGALEQWFGHHARNFPWRGHPTPYAVWISEVMLQQTQAAVVVPYFIKWMHTFPSIHALAQSSLDQVIKVWEGLGYYSRARNLHIAAQLIVDQYNGQLPSSFQELISIPGIGSYTAGAILSFAFHQKAAAVDANVARVIARIFLLEEELTSIRSKKKLIDLTSQVLPDKKPWVVMEALIELGATICGKSPACHRCPVAVGCLSYQAGREKELPIKKKSPTQEFLYRYVFVVVHQEALLVQQVKGEKLMQGLHEFPYLETDLEKISPEQLIALFLKRWGLPVAYEYSLKRVQHSFTRYKAELFPQVFTTRHRKEVVGYKWVEKNQWEACAFSSGHRRILKEYQNRLDTNRLFV